MTKITPNKTHAPTHIPKSGLDPFLADLVLPRPPPSTISPHPLDSRRIQPQIRRHRHLPSTLVIGEPQICRHRHHHLPSTLVIVAGFSLKYSFPLPDEALQALVPPAISSNVPNTVEIEESVSRSMNKEPPVVQQNILGAENRSSNLEASTELNRYSETERENAATKTQADLGAIWLAVHLRP